MTLKSVGRYLPLTSHYHCFHSQAMLCSCGRQYSVVETALGLQIKSFLQHLMEKGFGCMAMVILLYNMLIRTDSIELSYLYLLNKCITCQGYMPRLNFIILYHCYLLIPGALRPLQLPASPLCSFLRSKSIRLTTFSIMSNMQPWTRRGLIKLCDLVLQYWNYQEHSNEVRAKLLSFLATAARRLFNVSTPRFIILKHCVYMNNTCGRTGTIRSGAIPVPAFDRCWMAVPSFFILLLHSQSYRGSPGKDNT